MPDLSLYIHIPFCDKKCSYCDFNSYAGIDNLMPAYAEALVREIAMWAPACREYLVSTIFFGGGTPSRMPLPEMERIFGAVHDSLTLADTCEVSLEANPGTVEAEYFRGLRSLGVNRLSFGVQSLHDDELQFLDRIHSAEEARQAYRWARAAGFDNISMDLIYGLPEQPLERWQKTVEGALLMAPDHLSMYALTVEEGTQLGYQVSRGEVPAPDPDAAADHYDWTCERVAAAGFDHYEISNWSIPGRRCRHNLTYWRNRPYLGMGAGAHSFFRGLRFADVSAPNRYVFAVAESWQAAQSGDGSATMRQIGEGEQMTPEREMSDTIILGLRLNDGVDLADFQERFGVDLAATFAPQVEELTALELVELTADALRLTDRGRLFHNEAALRFLE